MRTATISIGLLLLGATIVSAQAPDLPCKGKTDEIAKCLNIAVGKLIGVPKQVEDLETANKRLSEQVEYLKGRLQFIEDSLNDKVKALDTRVTAIKNEIDTLPVKANDTLVKAGAKITLRGIIGGGCLWTENESSGGFQRCVSTAQTQMLEITRVQQ